MRTSRESARNDITCDERTDIFENVEISKRLRLIWRTNLLSVWHFNWFANYLQLWDSSTRTKEVQYLRKRSFRIMSPLFPVRSSAVSRSVLLRERSKERMWEPFSTVMLSGQLLVGSGAGVRLRVAAMSAKLPIAASAAADSIAAHLSTCAIASTTGAEDGAKTAGDGNAAKHCGPSVAASASASGRGPPSATRLHTSHLQLFTEQSSAKSQSKREYVLLNHLFLFLLHFRII